MPAPIVSVVIPVHNAMPYLRKGIDSLLRQSIGKDHIEVIAVDDGSTDGSGEALDAFAAAEPGTVRVVHQEASGTPSVPRNRGIDLARGKYVFFLDADDYLGPEALERMVAMAEANESDVVLGKLVGVGGRAVARSMFERDQPRADLYSSRVYWNLPCLKLFRKSMLEEHGLRFRTDRRFIEDLLFTVEGYVRARNISVVGDYDCYYVVRREDGGNLTSGGMAAPGHFRQSAGTHLELLVELVASLVPEGPKRDFLLKRHWEVEGCIEMRRIADAAGLDAAERQYDSVADDARLRYESLRRVVARWYTPGSAALLLPGPRLQYQLVLADRWDDLVRMQRDPDDRVFCGRGDRVYIAVPGNEDAVAPGLGPWADLTESLEVRHWLKGIAIGGGTLRIEGTGRIAPVPTDLIRLRLEAVHDTGTVLAVDLEHEDGHFTAEFDRNALLASGKGTWRFALVVIVGETERRATLGARLGGPLHGRAHPRPSAVAGRWRLTVGYAEDHGLAIGVEPRYTAKRIARAARSRTGSLKNRLAAHGTAPKQDAPRGA